MNDHDTVGSEMDVQLEAIGAGRKAGIEGWDCVLRPERHSPAVSEDKRMVGIKELQDVNVS
jgi:hypothetical protein